MAVPFPRISLHFMLLLALALLAPASKTAAQPGATGNPGGTRTASLAAVFENPAHEIRRELKAKDVVGEVTVLQSDKPFPAGGSAFATIKLTNTGKNRHASVELRLETDLAHIRNVFGATVDISGGDRKRTAVINILERGKPASIVVEVGLRSGTDTAAQEPRQNSLTITLQSLDSPPTSTTLNWDVIDCAGKFYTEIAKVRAGSGAGIASALSALRTRDSSRPARWLFKPRFVSANRKGRCLRTAKRWNRRRGRYVHVCTEHEQNSSDVAVSPVRYERTVYAFASRLVASRAADRELAPTRDSGWAISRVSKNLKEFLDQDPHPAICTGPLQVFDYFDKRLAGFSKRAAKYDEMAEKSYALALLRTAEALEAAKADSGGHPGWGATPLDTHLVADGMSRREMMKTLSTLTGDAELGERIAQSRDAFAALQAMSEFLKSDAAESLGTGTRSALRSALGAIEAADYIGFVARNYADLHNALSGSMERLRQAHAESCNCGS